MIYAIVELQNPLPRKIMLWKGDMNISARRSDTFTKIKVSASDSALFDGGRGVCTPTAHTKKGKDPENLKKALVVQLLLAVIVVFITLLFYVADHLKVWDFRDPLIRD